MSVVICYISDGFSIIATDTRLSKYKSIDSNPEYEDNSNKLFNSPRLKFGWAAGVGLSELNKDYLNDLSCELYLNADTVQEFYKIQCDYYEGQYKDFADKANGSAFAFHCEIENRMQLCMVNKDTLVFLRNDRFEIFFPSDYTDEMIQKFYKTYEMDYKFNDGFNNLISVILKMFEEISSNSKSVSRVCDIGIAIGNSECKIKGHVRDDINVLINKLENEELGIDYTVFSHDEK